MAILGGKYVLPTLLVDSNHPPSNINPPHAASCMHCTSGLTCHTSMDRALLATTCSCFSRFITYPWWSDSACSRILLLHTDLAPEIQRLVKFRQPTILDLNLVRKLHQSLVTNHLPAFMNIHVVIEPGDGLAVFVHVRIPFCECSILHLPPSLHVHVCTCLCDMSGLK